MKTKHLIISSLLAVSLFGGCDTSAPEPEFLTKVDLFLSQTEKVPLAQLTADIAASDKILGAFNDMDVPQLADLLIAAHKRGAFVRIVGDEDSKDQVGFQKLIAADVPVMFGDGEFTYLPDPNLGGTLEECGIKSENVIRCPRNPATDDAIPAQRVMTRTGAMNIMSHNFLLTNKTTIWNLSRGASSDVTGPLVGYRVESERMYEVFEREQRQLFGGAFSTNLDVYNGPTKSAQQNNPSFNAESYLSDVGEFKTMFNPQERLVKKVIDEAYRAKASVWIVTDNLVDDVLVDALRYKDKYFDVRVITNAASQTPAVFEGSDDFVKKAPAEMTYLPTIIIIDSELDPNKEKRPRQVMVLSHPLHRAAAFRILPPTRDGGDDRAEIYTSDYFIDGNLWGISEYNSQVGEASDENPGRIKEIDQFVSFFDVLWDKSSKL